MSTSTQIWKWSFVVWYILVFSISSSTTFAFFFRFFGGWIPEGLVDPFIAQLMSGVAGVLLFDIAAIIWLFVYLRGAGSVEQRSISISMTFVDFLGAAMASVAYLALTASGDLALDAVTKDIIGLLALVVVIIGVVLNFGASLGFSRYEPKMKEEVREADRRDRIEKAQGESQRKLDDEVARKLKDKIDGLSSSIAERQSKQLAQGFYDVENNRFEITTPEEVTEPQNLNEQRDLALVAENKCLYCGAPLNNARRKYCNENHRKYYHRNGPKN